VPVRCHPPAGSATAGRGGWHRTALVGATVAVALGGCASRPAGTAGSPAPSPSGPSGLGAARTVWDAHHGAGYSSVVTDSSGRVQGYLLVVTPRRLDDAERLVLADLPPDAVAGAPQTGHGVEGTVCEIVEFTSPTLGRVLGGPHGDRVTAAFQTDAAIVMDPTRITHIVVASANEGLPSAC
jgi:hypothetical protein